MPQWGQLFSTISMHHKFLKNEMKINRIWILTSLGQSGPWRVMCLAARASATLRPGSATSAHTSAAWQCYFCPPASMVLTPPDLQADEHIHGVLELAGLSGGLLACLIALTRIGWGLICSLPLQLATVKNQPLVQGVHICGFSQPWIKTLYWPCTDSPCHYPLPVFT